MLGPVLPSLGLPALSHCSILVYSPFSSTKYLETHSGKPIGGSLHGLGHLIQDPEGHITPPKWSEEQPDITLTYSYPRMIQGCRGSLFTAPCLLERQQLHFHD